MKKVFALILYAGLLCTFACGRTAPEPVTTVPSTVEIETTHEEPTTEEPTTVFVPMSGESNGVMWRTLDLEDEANAALKVEFLSLFNENVEFKMGTNTIILEKDYPKYQYVMAENNGKRTVILPRRGSIDYGGTVATFITALDDRYFLFCWSSVDDLCGFGIYDTKELREIPLDIEQSRWGFLKANSNLLFFTDYGQYGAYNGTKHLWAYDWTVLKQEKPLIATDI